MYYLSTLIDNRKYHVLKMVPSSVSSAIVNLPSFVLERTSGQNKMVLSIAADALFIHHGGFSKDKSIDWSKLHVDLSEQTLTVTLHAIEANTVLSEPLTALNNSLVMIDEKRYNFWIPATYTFEEIEIVVVMCYGENEKLGSRIKLHLAPIKQIYDLVMDFGSEASQIVTHRRGGDSSIFERNNLVQDLLTHYYPNLKSKTLHQQTNDDSKLYRSMFFFKRTGAVFDPTQQPGANGENELLNLLTDKDEINKLITNHILVPNLKLAHLGGYKFNIEFESKTTNIFHAEKDSLNELILKIQQGVLNYFIQTILKGIKKGSEDKIHSNKYVVVRLLVPNVFDQEKVSKMVEGTYEGLYNIMQLLPESHLKGFEVNTISESDASFLGFKREQEEEKLKKGSSMLKRGKSYLIIDAGKGTTDFSILTINHTNYQLSSHFRSGFIGAGNVLSFAFIDSVFTSIFGKGIKQRQQSILKASLSHNTDLSEKINLTETIEKLKRKYNPSTQNKCKSLAELIPSEIEDVLKELNENPNGLGVLRKIVTALDVVISKQGSIKDEFGIINDCVDDLVDKIFQEVTQSGRYFHENIEKIILTGRGFLFNGLSKKINERFGIETIITQDPKKVCLLGAFSGDHVNFDSNLVGYPETYDLYGDSTQNRGRNIDLGNNQPKINIPIFNRFAPEKEYLQKINLNDWMKNMIVGKIVEDDDFFEEEPKTRTEQTQVPTKALCRSDEEDFFLRGKRFYNFNKDAKTISICGLDYKNHTVNSAEVNVFYTGDNFIIRGPHTSSTLQIFPDFFRKNQLVFQTLYPFVEISEYDQIAIRTLIDDEDF